MREALTSQKSDPSRSRISQDPSRASVHESQVAEGATAFLMAHPARLLDAFRQLSPSAGSALRIQLTQNLQRTHGNQAVMRLVRASKDMVLQRKCGPCSSGHGSCPTCAAEEGVTLRPKLTVSEPGDLYEREADRVAEQVMRMPDAGIGELHPQDRPRLQAKMAPGRASDDPSDLQAQVSVIQGGGQPLSRSVRDFFEPRFGYDFGRVRVHTGAREAAAARAVNALAYTIGHDVVFGAGQYAPATHAGRQLLAHELAHVVQQSGRHATPARRRRVNRPHGDGGRKTGVRPRPTPVSPVARQIPALSVEPMLQRTCGAALGAPVPDCKPMTGDPTNISEIFEFDFNCDTLKPTAAARVPSFISGLAPGTTLKVHGYASTDGPAAFNMNLSCHRANQMASVLRAASTAFPVTDIFKHGPTPGPNTMRRAAWVEIIAPVPPPKPIPTPTPPTPPPLCAAVPTSTPTTCAGRNRGYCAAARCFPTNPWLSCACVASGDVCRAVDAFTFTGLEGMALEACTKVPPPGAPPGPIISKGRWLLSTNQCIWGHWRAAFEAIHDPTRPVPSTLTPEWATAVTTCRRVGFRSSDCCRAHVTAEQNAIDRCGPYSSATFGPLPSDVPGAPTCSAIVAAFTPGPPFTGDFGRVADRIAYGNSRCCP